MSSFSKKASAALAITVIVLQLSFFAGSNFINVTRADDTATTDTVADAPALAVSTDTSGGTDISGVTDTSGTTDTSASTDVVAPTDSSATTDSASTDTSSDVSTTSATPSDVTSGTSDQSTTVTDTTTSNSTTDTSVTQTTDTTTQTSGGSSNTQSTPVVSPTLTTDKADYNPGQTATIFGSFFQALQDIVLKIFGGSTSDGTYTETTKNVTADSAGAFTTTYTLDDITRPLYNVVASTIDGIQLAQTTFTDPPKPPQPPTAGVTEYSQCSNDQGVGYGPTDTGCRWINGNLQSNNSVYHEGDATPQRLFLTDVEVGPTHTVTFQYDVMKSQASVSKHAYDFLTDYNWSELNQPTTGIADTDVCDNAASNGFASIAECATKVAAPSVTPIPATSPASLICGSIGNTGNMRLANGTISSVDAPVIAAGTNPCTGAVTDGDVDAAVTVHYTVADTCANYNSTNNTCPVVFFFGAHISKQAVYGAGRTAVDISGSPYHVALVEVDGSSIGQRDNQMQAATIVSNATSTVTTNIHNAAHDVVTSVPAGTTVHDSATVSGSAGTPTGSVTFDWFTNGGCSGSPSATSGSSTLSSGSVDGTTFTQGPLNAGSYSFRANYGGNSTYSSSTSACEPLTVTKLNSTTTTAIHNGSNHTTDVQNTTISLGSTIHDQATVTGSFGTPTGTSTFQYWTNDSCASTPASSSVALALSGGVVDATGFAQGPLAVGSYSFKATYSGNTNYNGSVGSCEKVTVGKANTTTETKVHDTQHNDITNTAVSLGSVVHDAAFVNTQVDGIVIGGTVTYHFFANGTCTSTPASNEAVAVGTESSATSPLGAGSYSYKADYSGDTNYASSTGVCEPFTVNKSQLVMESKVHNTSHVDVTNGSLPLSSVVHDTAKITGGVVGSFTPPPITFKSYTNGSCSLGEASVSNVGADEGDATRDRSTSSASLAAGAYAYKAFVASSSDYIGTDSGCEPFNVVDAKISIGQNGTNEVNQQHTFTGHVDVNPGTGFVNAPNGTVITFSLSGVGALSTSSCVTAGGTGSCSVTDISSVAGVDTVNASTSVVVGGVTLVRTTNGTAGNSGPATKTWVDASIALTPQTGTNAVGQSHAITAHVTKNDGGGVTDAAGVTVTFSITSGTATFVGGVNTCVTNASGTCSIAINSSSTGSNTIDATTTFTVGGVSLTRATNGNSGPDGSDAAEKAYVNARIRITPATSTNEVGNEHTFVVTVEQDAGSGFVPVASGTLANAIVSPTPTSFDVSDCNNGVNASGQCNVVINSSVAGIFTITARSTVVVNGVTFKLQTNGVGANSGPATKTYVDLQIKIDSNSTNEVNHSHTFTVTVKSDPGTGTFGPVSGATVTPGITGTGSLTGTGTCETGVTNGSGQCTIIVNSATTGVGTVSAATTVIVGGVSMTRSLGDGLSGDSAKATKTWVDAQIKLSPLTATNNINSPHTITATVKQDLGDGAGFVSAPNGTLVTFSLLNNTALASFVGGVNTCTTTGGTCSVQINSATPGSVDIHAVTTFSVGGVSLTRASGDGLSGDSANANKIYVAGKITIVKDAQPNDLIDFPFNGTAPFGSFSLDDDAGVSGEDSVLSNSKASGFIAPGNYTVTETEPNAFWTFGGVSCVITGTATPFTNVTNVANGVTINLAAGDDVTCTFVNTKESPTRTLGFWQTHTAYTSGVFAASPISSNMPIGTAPHKGFITTTAQLFGAFYSSIPKLTTGAKRTDLDKARMQLLQQLVAAKLNCANFGCAGSVLTTIATADAAYAGSSVSAILASASALDLFNNSGDTITIGPAGPATPKTSSGLADKVFWDAP